MFTFGKSGLNQVLGVFVKTNWPFRNTNSEAAAKLGKIFQ